MKLGRNDKTKGPIRTRVVFATKDTRNEVYKKKNLKGSGTWISDELIPYRNRMAYFARSAVNNKQALQTWTARGRSS